MKNRTNIFVVLLIFFAFSSFAQQFGAYPMGSALNLNTDNGFAANKPFTPDVTIALGSSFSSFGNGFNAFGTFISPEISFPVHKKFTVNAGLTYSTLNYTGFGSENSVGQRSFDQYGSVYVSGLYQLTEKISIAGTAFKTFPLSDQSPKANPRALDFSNEGVVIDMNYQLSDKVRLSAGFKYQKQNTFNDYNSFGGYNSFGSPFNHSMFGPGF
jgi:hypothetical protein